MHKKNKNIIFSVPLHGNLGDHAIIHAESLLLKQHSNLIYEIPTKLKKYYLHILQKSIVPADRLYITGGGFMGSQWLNEELFIREIICEFPENKIVIFPQSLYYENTSYGKDELEKSIDIYNAHKNLTIYAREQFSYKIMKQLYPECNIKICPDMVLSLGPVQMKGQRRGVLLCFRKDKESAIDSSTKESVADYLIHLSMPFKYVDTVIDGNIYKFQRRYKLRQKLRQFRKSRLIVTDRLHGMIFAYLTSTPCAVFSNNNHKIKGVYKWIATCNNIQLISEQDNLEKELNQLLNCSDENDHYYRISNSYFQVIYDEIV